MKKIYFLRCDFDNKPCLQVAEVIKETPRMFILESNIDYTGRLRKDDRRISFSFEEAKTKEIKRIEERIEDYKKRGKKEEKYLDEVKRFEEK